MAKELEQIFFFLHNCINSLQIYRMKLLVEMLNVCIFQTKIQNEHATSKNIIWMDSAVFG